MCRDMSHEGKKAHEPQLLICFKGLGLRSGSGCSGPCIEVILEQFLLVAMVY